MVDDFVPALELHCPGEGNKKSPSSKRKAIHMIHQQTCTPARPVHGIRRSLKPNRYDE
jgi:hypothetical protein